jgi:hypothetical protein
LPIVTHHRVIGSHPYRVDGVQYIENVLTLPTAPDTATIYLGRYTYSGGTYALFDYSTSTAGTPIVGDLAQVVVNTSDLFLASSGTLANDTTFKIITVTLTSKADNGQQFVDGTLTIGGPMTISLHRNLYGSAGTYTLFAFGTLVGSITDITIVPPSGLSVDTSVSPNGLAVVGSTITVTLV